MRFFSLCNLLLVSILVWFGSCKINQESTKGPKLRSYRDKNVTGVRLPYILDISDKTKRLTYFGANHSNNPADTMFDDIERKFTELRPQIAFNEGGNWPIYNNRDSTIRFSGEPGFLRLLCKINNVRVQSIEPPDSLEVNYLLNRFKREDVLLMYFVRQLDQLIRENVKDIESEKQIMMFIQTLNRKGFNLTGNERNHKYFISLYENFYQKPFDKKTFDPTTFWPIYDKTLLNKISSESSYFRDRYAIQEIEKALKKYDRVFVIMGGSHLVVQEPILRYLFKK